MKEKSLHHRHDEELSTEQIRKETKRGWEEVNRRRRRLWELIEEDTGGSSTGEFLDVVETIFSWCVPSFYFLLLFVQTYIFLRIRKIHISNLVIQII